MSNRPMVEGDPILVVLSAPSGAGKTTLFMNLMEARPTMTRAITCTTRAPRDGEEDGVDYYFLDAEAFLRRVQAGHFLEHATVYGNSYGTLKSEVVDKLRMGRDVLLSVDVQGAAEISEQARSDALLQGALVTVFLTPPSIEELRKRLEARAKDSVKDMAKRLRVARHEIEQWKHFDYLIISDTQEMDLERMQKIVDAEKMRASRNHPPALREAGGGVTGPQA